MAKENREYKDSLFVDLFYSDETAKKNLLSLYNALHGTDLKDEGLIRKVKIEDILYKNFNNDISCEVDNKSIRIRRTPKYSKPQHSGQICHVRWTGI